MIGTIAEAWEVKNIVQRARNESSLAHGQWLSYPAHPDYPALMDEARKLSEYVGIKMPWQDIPLTDRYTIARELLTDSRHYRCIENLNNRHARQTHNKSVDTYLDLEGLRTKGAVYGDYPTADKRVIHAFSDLMNQDFNEQQLDAIYPFNPEKLTLRLVPIILECSHLTPEEAQKLTNYAIKCDQARGIPTPLFVTNLSDGMLYQGAGR